MTVAIVIPAGGTDPDRTKALEWITGRYERLHPNWGIHIGECSGEWSKGAAVADGLSRTDADTIVIADGDSFIPDLTRAVTAVETGTPWVVPHRLVYRLTRSVTRHVLDDGEAIARRTDCVRRPYAGPPGGGIVVLNRDTYNAVGGIDPRFLGWGGEDVSFGWALRTLVGHELRFEAPLFHLWHPHPAPNLRGSPESEELVARYTEATGIPRLMRAIIAGTEPEPEQWLNEPAQFTATNPKLVVRVGVKKARFVDGEFSTRDSDIVDHLRVRHDVTEAG